MPCLLRRSEAPRALQSLAICQLTNHRPLLVNLTGSAALLHGEGRVGGRAMKAGAAADGSHGREEVGVGVGEGPYN